MRHFGSSAASTAKLKAGEVKGIYCTVEKYQSLGLARILKNYIIEIVSGGVTNNHSNPFKTKIHVTGQ